MDNINLIFAIVLVVGLVIVGYLFGILDGRHEVKSELEAEDKALVERKVNARLIAEDIVVILNENNKL